MIYSIWLVNQWKCAMLGKPKQRDFFQLGSTARLPRLPGRATRISFQDVPGFCVINYTNIGIDPKQSQQETKGKRLALACINMKKNCMHIDFLSQCTCKQRCKDVPESCSQQSCGCCCSKTLQIPPVYKHSWLKKS